MDRSFFWLALAIILMVGELLVPGGVIFFLGLGGLCVFALLQAGLISSWTMAFIAWFILSTIFLLVLRSFFMKYFEGDFRVQSTDEDKDAFGDTATVLEAISPSLPGRISFRGTTWVAKSEYDIAKGATVVVEKREENAWVVNPVDFKG